MICRETVAERAQSRWFWVAALAVLADGVTTVVAIQNPLLAESVALSAFVLAVGGAPGFLAFKVAQASVLAFVPRWIGSVAFRAACAGTTVWFGYLAVNNAWLAFKWA